MCNLKVLLFADHVVQNKKNCLPEEASLVEYHLNVISHANILCRLRLSVGYRFVTSFALEVLCHFINDVDIALDILCQMKRYRIPILLTLLRLGRTKSELDH